MTDRTTARETIDSLTGFEEDKILTMTGLTVDVIADRKMDLKLTRALAAIRRLRANPDLTPGEAWQQVQALTQTELAHEFDDEPDDVMPDDPDSEAGKDESFSDTEHSTLRVSASPLG
jgi:hypothetical protein